MPEPTPVKPPPTLPSLDERLSAVEVRMTYLENRPPAIVSWAKQAGVKVVGAWPMVKEWLPWALVLVLLLNQQGGCNIHWPTPDHGPTPAPIPAEGLHVLFVWDKQKANEYDRGQLEAIQSSAVRLYLDSHAAKGADGKTPEYRMFETTSDVSQESKLFKDAFARPRSSLPWVWIVKGNRGYEGPVPKTPDELLALLKKYGGE